jgi:serum/glucocorticoid-regulated kinase 2
MINLKLEPFYSIQRADVPLTLNDFQLLKCIGVGGFSRVYLVRRLDSGLFYAMKIMEKEFIF